MNVEKYLELEKVRAGNPDGMLLPKEVVNAARDEASPLHGDFTWADDEAAEKYREMEARQIIRAAVVFEPRLQRKTRAYISVPTDRMDGGGYRPTPDVIGNQDFVAQLTEEVRNKLHGMRGSYTHLRALDPLWSQIDSVVEEFLSQRQAAAA